jgi:hypothetical protein
MSVLVQHIVYFNPSDCPGKYVIRKVLIDDGKFHMEKAAIILDSYAQVREFIPDGLVRMSRHQDDDPVIVETWI